MITIRIATRSDASTIAQYNAAMALETEHLRLDMERLQSGVNGIFDDPSRGFYLVAEHNGTVIGQLMITYEWSDWRNGVFWWIQSVYVKEEFRAKKVFRSLYDHSLAMANEKGNVCGIRLYVEKENERAHAVYEKLGMSVTQYNLFEKDFILKR
ncbi:MAG: GNAT family N-acetyltransferase [Ignavibacteriales bacterium]|nr:GNAT family N-acetyltransferase [Ignavibacteriales bacterium]